MKSKISKIVLNKNSVLASAPIILILTSALWRIFLLIRVSDYDFMVTPDSERYLNAANNLGDYYFKSGASAISDSFIVTPGFPLFLSLLHLNNILALAVALSLILTFSQILFLSLISKVFTNLRLRIFFAAFISLDFSSNFSGMKILSESVFLFLISLGCYFYFKDKFSYFNISISGLFFGFAVLTRPIAQVIIFALLLLIPLATKVELKKFLISFILLSLISLSWMVRNEIVFDSFKISGIYATNLLYYEGAAVVAEKTNISLDEVQKRERSRGLQKTGLTPSPKVISEYESNRAYQLLRENYIWIPILHLKGVIKVLFGPGLSDINNLYVSIPSLIKPLQVLSLCLNIFAIFFAMIGLFSSIVPKRIKFTLIFISVFLLLASSGASANSRLRVPLVPVIAFFASAGLEKCLTKFNKFSPTIS